MRLNHCLLLLLFISCALPSCATESSSGLPQSTESGTLETEEQKLLYTLGHVLGQNIGNADLSENELATVSLGLTDSALGRESLVDLDG